MKVNYFETKWRRDLFLFCMFHRLLIINFIFTGSFHRFPDHFGNIFVETFDKLRQVIDEHFASESEYQKTSFFTLM